MLNEEQRMVRDMVRELALKELAEQALRVDHQGSLPGSVFQKLGELALMAACLPEEVGGGDTDTVSYALAIEELGRACGATAFVVNLHTALGCLPLHRSGSPLAGEWLPRLCAGQALAGCLVLDLEPEFDGLTGASATQTGDGWRLEGAPRPVANGARLDLLVVPAESSEGLTLFAVPTQTEGVEVGKRLTTIGLRGVEWAEVALNGVTLSDAHRLTGPGQAEALMAEAVALFDLGVAAAALGTSEIALHHGIEYLAQRKQFGKQLGRFEGLRHMVAEMATSARAGRLLVHHAAALRDAGQEFAEAVAMARLHLGDAACRITKDALQLHGGNGYTREYPAERFYRDARMAELVGGSAERQKDRLAARLITL